MFAGSTGRYMSPLDSTRLSRQRWCATTLAILPPHFVLVQSHITPAMLAHAYLTVIKHQATEGGEKGATTAPMRS